MKIIIKFYCHDGIDSMNIIGDEQEYVCHVRTYSDWHDSFNAYILSNIDDNLYVNIKSIKVIDIP